MEIRSNEKLERCKRRYEKCEQEGASTLRRKRGRPASILSLEDLLTNSKRRSTNFCSSRCVLCQSEDEKQALHEVQSIALGKRLKNIVLHTEDDLLKARSSDLASDDALSAVAQDMKYHLPCLTKHERQTKENASKMEDHNQNLIKLISTEELIHIVQKELSVPDKILNRNEINKLFIDLLEGSGYEKLCESKNYKKYLKSSLTEGIPNIDFSKSNLQNMPEMVTLNITKDRAVSTFDENSKIKDEFSLIFRAASVLRAYILQSTPKWSFKGNFDDFKIPPLLFQFCKLLNFGTKKIGEIKNEKLFQDKQVSIMSQFIMQSIKSKDQKVDTNFVRETPPFVGLGLRVHYETRSKSLLKVLERLNITVSYKKIFGN